jgi:D-psicose/D-tagatose/L-ribulose 3-epimerase
MRFGVHCRLWTTGWSPADLDLIDRARDFGFSVFEVGLLNLAAVDPTAIRRRAEAVDMTLIGSMGLPKDKGLATSDRSVRSQTVAFLKAAVEATRDMGAQIFGGMMYAVPGRFSGKGPTEAEIQWIVDGLSEVAVFAQNQGVTLALEPVNRFESYLLNTAAQAQSLVDQIDQPNVGLLLDTFHMNIEDRGIAATIRRHAKSLRHLHLNESDRGMLGNANIDWPALFAALKEIGYRGAASLETFAAPNPNLAASTSIWRELFPSPDELAREGLAFLTRMAESHGCGLDGPS